MENLNFSEPIKINVRDARNSVMVDYVDNKDKIHFFYLTDIIDEETGQPKKDENNHSILHIARIDYELDDKKDYKSAITNKEIPEEDTFLVKTTPTEEEPEPKLIDVISFNVKNFLVAPNELTKAYAFINVKDAEKPIFRYGEDLKSSLITINKGDLD